MSGPQHRTVPFGRPAPSRPSSADTAPAPRRRTRAEAGGILAVEGLSLSFGGAVAFAEIDLTVEAGEIHAIIGPNGAGKSSLINAISGLYAPQAGRVRIGDACFAQVPARRLAALGVARTFQNLALFKSLSVVENVLSGLAGAQRAGLAAQLLGLPAARREAAEHRARASSVIDLLQLESVRDRAAGSLPYGLQKRVELARALIAKPRLLLLDEPMAGMSAAEKAEMSGFVLAARETFGTAIVLIEHDIGVVMRLSDRITVLDHGRRIATGTPEEIQANPAVIAAYLGQEDENGDDVEAKAA